MRTKNFYLIDSPKINELNQAEKDLLEQQLSIYHNHLSPVTDKAKAIEVLAKKDGITKLRYEYNAWLYNFVNCQLKTVKTEEENEALKKMLAYCYSRFGLKSDLEGNFINALDNYKKAIKIQKKLKDKKGLFFTSYNIALIYYKNGDLSNTIELYEQCVELCREIEDKTVLAAVYNNLSFVLKNKGNLSKSLNYLHKALSIYKENNDENGIALIYYNIGDLLLSQLEIDQALKYYLKSLKLSESIGDDNRQIVNCIAIGSIHQKKCENDTALKYYLKAVKLPQTNQPNNAYLQIGTLYESQNQIDLAMDYYSKSLQLSERIEHKKLLSETLSKIGALELKRGNVKKANFQIKRGFKLAQELNYPELIKEAAAAKILLAIAIKDYKLAYEMETLKNEMKEKIQNIENTKAVIKHQLKYEYEKLLKQKDIEIEEEKQNNQQLQAEIDLLLINNKRLAFKNKTINEQYAEKDEQTHKF